jgi:hypothetical protein
MKKSFESLGERLLDGIDRSLKRLDRAGVYIAAVLTVTLIGVGIWGTVKGQSAAYLDVPGSYQAGMGKVNAATNDSGQNVETLDESARLAAGINLAGDLVGVSNVYGTAAAERAEALDLPEMTRVGLLGTVDGEVMALASDPPGVSLPQHFAKQWVPGYENSDTSVYAQGEDGYTFLRDTVGVEPIWEMMRNFAYALFVIIIMVAGFMIMFRSKIGGQATVSIMNALPGIVIGLLAVTFSFAIVGFIMDIGRLICMMLGQYMSSALGFPAFQLGDPFEMAWAAFNNMRAGFPGINNLSGVFGPLFMTMMFIPGVNLVGIIGIILILVLAAIAFYAAIRVYITLVMSYVKILIELIFSPLYIVMGSLPGRSGTITSWIKRVFSHVLVFPVIFFMLNLAGYLGQSSVNTGFNQAIHFLSGTTGGASLIQLRGIFVIAIYFIAAGAPGIVQEMIGAEENKGISNAVEGAKKAAGKIPLVGGLLG